MITLRQIRWQHPFFVILLSLFSIMSYLLSQNLTRTLYFVANNLTKCYYSPWLPLWHPASRVSFNLPRSVGKRKETLHGSSPFRVECALKIQTYSGVSHVRLVTDWTRKIEGDSARRVPLWLKMPELAIILTRRQANWICYRPGSFVSKHKTTARNSLPNSGSPIRWLPRVITNIVLIERELEIET